MNYEQLRYSAPEGLPGKKKEPRPIGPKSVLVFFLAEMLLFAVFGTIIQTLLGMIGVLITEAFFLIFSILYARWKGHRMRDIFPVKKPKLSALAGTILLWIGGYFLIYLGNLLVMAYLPDFPVNTDMETILSFDMNWILLFLIVAVSPAICEEAMHRGVIQYGMRRKIRSPWVMALVMGTIFGVFHMDPSKFFSTALLGGIMSWIMFQTDNMVYSSLFHFIHNGSQMILLGFITGMAAVPGITDALKRPADSTVFAEELASIPDTAALMISAGILSIILGLIIPVLLYVGNWLLIRDIAPRKRSLFPKDTASRRRVKRIFLAVYTCFAVIGIGSLVLGFLIS